MQLKKNTSFKVNNSQGWFNRKLYEILFKIDNIYYNLILLNVTIPKFVEKT